MNWFSILKAGKKRHMLRRAKEVRAFFRPIVYAKIEDTFSNSKVVDKQELHNLVDEVVTVSRYKEGNPNSEIREVKTYTVNSIKNYYQMASYKLKQMGFTFINHRQIFIRRE